MSCQVYGSSAWDRGIFWPLIGPRHYVSERFGVSGERRPTGRVGSGAEPDGRGYQYAIRPWGRERMPAPGIGAVPGRTSRDG